MRYFETELKGVFIFEPNVFEDERGYFFESFRKSIVAEALGYDIDFVQDNESKSCRGVLRGIHYQLPPFAQSKLVRVVKGKIWDVAVDLRRSSPNFGRWIGVILDDESKRQIFIPRGFGHGFVVLSDEAIVAYKVDNYYSREYDRGIFYADEGLNIDWPLEKAEIILSNKDAGLPLLRDAEVFE